MTMAKSPETYTPAFPRTPRQFVRESLTLLGPIVVVYLVVLLAVSVFGGAVAIQAEYMLVNLVLVVGLQVFVGNSGVLSFGHISFAAVGGWVMGLATIDPVLKNALMGRIFPVLLDLQLNPFLAVFVATCLGGLMALIVGPVLMRMNGLQAGIASFALLLVTVEILRYWRQIGPPTGQAMTSIPNAFSVQTLLWLSLSAIVVSWIYQRTTTARLLRGSRESLTAAPASGIHTATHRLIAFVISGAICGMGGALFAETNGSMQSSSLSVQTTFTIVAMLVLGGTLSLWGAVVGTLVFTIIDSALIRFQSGVQIGDVIVSVPEGARLIILGAVLITVLLFRPDGITRGHEFGSKWRFLQSPSEQLDAEDTEPKAEPTEAKATGAHRAG